MAKPPDTIKLFFEYQHSYVHKVFVKRHNRGIKNLNAELE